MRVYMYVFIHVCVHVFLFVCMHECTNVQMRVHVHICTYRLIQEGRVAARAAQVSTHLIVVWTTANFMMTAMMSWAR